MEMRCAGLLCFPEIPTKGLRKTEESFFQNRHLQLVYDRLTLLLRNNKTGLTQDCKMRGHGWLGYAEMLRQLARTHGALPQQFKNATADRVRKSFENHIHYLIN